jgi:hypothetical protein
LADNSGSIKEPLLSVAISSRLKQRSAEYNVPGRVDDLYKQQSTTAKAQNSVNNCNVAKLSLGRIDKGQLEESQNSPIS